MYARRVCTRVYVSLRYKRPSRDLLVRPSSNLPQNSSPSVNPIPSNMRVTPTIILLASTSASPLLSRALTTSSPQHQDRRATSAAQDSRADADNFHQYATKIEDTLFGFKADGVRLYLKDDNNYHKPSFHEITQNIDESMMPSASVRFPDPLMLSLLAFQL